MDSSLILIIFALLANVTNCESADETSISFETTSTSTESPKLPTSTVPVQTVTKIQSDDIHNDSLSLEIFWKPENLTGWSNWSVWSGCSSTCGIGVKIQERNCTIEQCEGVAKRTQPCSSGLCPTWNIWSPWSLCSKTCGMGEQQRSRTCTVESKCLGISDETKPCAKPICNLANWSQWSQFTSCENEKLCGMGTSTRHRDCPTGMKCFGLQNETRPCLITTAPVCGIWTSWTDWSTCSRSCSGGVQQRTRMCAGGTLTPGCSGYADDFHQCNTQPCHTWSDWQWATDCSAKCNAAGMRSRNRTCADQLCTGPSQENVGCVHLCT